MVVASDSDDRLPSCPICPICHGEMEVVYDRFQQRVMVCVDCQCGLTVPDVAYEVRRLKREGTWIPASGDRRK